MASRFRWAMLAAALAASVPVAAQDTTGSVAGTIRDASQAVLPGAAVTVSGPTVMGTRAAVSNERGEYTIRLLPPGTYELRADLNGFAPVARAGIEVRVGQTAAIDLDMAVGGLTESTEVRGDAPVIDVRNTVRNFTADANALALIPVSTTQQYTDLWVVAPGVRDSLATATGAVTPSVNGASATQNRIYVDGIDVTDHVNSGTTTALNNAVIQEAAISTGAFEAQAGFGSGGSMNIVTRSGGNAFHGGASMFLTPQRFNGTNSPGTSPADVETYFPEGHLGGPILRDKIWFFASDKYLYQNEGIFDVSAYQQEIRSQEAYAKVTHQPGTGHRLSYIFQHDRRLDDASFGRFDFGYDATPTGHNGGYMTGVNWDYQLGGKSLLSVVSSYFDKPNSTNGRNGVAPRTRFADAAGNVLLTDGNYDRDQENEQTRPYISAAFTRSFTAAGGHDLKLSTELYPRSRRLNRVRLNVIETYRDSPQFGPRQLWTVATPRPVEGVDNETIDRKYGFAVQDSWRPKARLTVNGGLRYETTRTIVEGRPEPLLDYDEWAPRLGAAYEINAKTVLKSSVSRIGEKLGLDYAFSFHPFRVVFDTATSSQVNGVLDLFTNGGSTDAVTTTRSVSRPVPSVLEYVVSLQRQLPGQIATDVSYVDRSFGNYAENVDRNLILDIPNRRFVGRVDPAFDALLDVVDTGRIKRKYRALQFWVNRRLANRWQLNASYTYAVDREDGEFGYNSALNAAQQFAYGDRGSQFYETERGPRHNVKLAGSYTFPLDVTVGLYFSKFSNTLQLDQYQVFPPGTLIPRVTLSNGRVVNDPLFNPVLLVGTQSEKIGRSIGGTDLVNLQIQKSVRVGTHQFRVMAMAYNLPNSAEPLNYSSRLVTNPNYDRLLGVQRPRAGQVSFGWEF